MNGWAKTKAAAKYAGVSDRTFPPWLKDGLRHSRLPSGSILIRYTAINEFLEHYSNDHNQVDEIVKQTLQEFSR
jgi:hypothetical protein